MEDVMPQDRFAQESRDRSKSMSDLRRKRPGLGVIVGRFQVPYLHKGHRHAIAEADKHDQLLIFVGMHPALVTITDPLDFPSRERMLKEAFPEAMIAPLRDQGSDKTWSDNLDATVRIYHPTGEVTLYCGRDGFKSHYSGRFPVVEVENISYDSGTELRDDVGAKVLGTVDFRRGVIYASQRQRIRIHPCVDVAMVRRPRVFASDGHEPGTMVPSQSHELEILLAQKAAMPGLWRFPGGFVGAEDDCTEATAKRELAEETGLYTSDGVVTRIGNYRVKDWRDTPSDRIFTDFFLAWYSSGKEQPGCDLIGGKLQWFPLYVVKRLRFADNHLMLMRQLLKYLVTQTLVEHAAVEEFDRAQDELVTTHG